jgi:hypothetical protein
LILGHAKRTLRKIDAIGPEPAGFRKRTKWINGRAAGTSQPARC